MSKEEEEQEEEKREHLVLIQMLELYLGYAKKWEAAGNKSEISQDPGPSSLRETAENSKGNLDYYNVFAFKRN